MRYLKILEVYAMKKHILAVLSNNGLNRRLFRTSFLLQSVNTHKFIRNVFATELGENVLTMRTVKDKLQKTLGAPSGFSPTLSSRAHLAKYLPSTQDDLPTRTMQDSFCSALLPLSKDVSLQDKYVTFLGRVRLGRLLEDMDLFANWIAHNHILNPKLPPDTPTPYTIVTVLVDQVDFNDVSPKSDGDIRLSGHVSWVGRSSLETVVWLEQKHQDTWQKITRALFLLAARDPTNTRAALINKLVPGNEEEQKIVDGGEGRKRRRKNAIETSVLKVIPDPEEQAVIHNIFLSTLDVRDPTYVASILQPGSMWMKDSTLDNMILSHPEDRNFHSKVFGGYILRLALELSWCCGWIHSKHRPVVKHMSNAIFHKPVDVSSLIKMRSQIVYSDVRYMQITVNVEVFDPITGMVSTTNVFHFTYEIAEEAPKVIPNTYLESMLYLDGRRHFQRIMGKK